MPSGIHVKELESYEIDSGKSGGSMLHIGICDDDRTVLENLAREVEGWAKEKAELCSVECFLTADSFLLAWDEK